MSVYRESFEHVNKGAGIKSKDGDKMFIFQSDLSGHLSFFIFHVNDKNKLTSISYCDGNYFDESQEIKNSKTHINGVTTFNLKTPIEYSDDFVQNFINQNSKDESIEDFYEKFQKKIEIQGAEIDYEATTHSIPTKDQKRNNCVFKSTSLLARFISQQQDPATMDFGFDPVTQAPTGNGYVEYKKFKLDLIKATLNSIIKLEEKISLKSDRFSEFLRDEIKDAIKITGAHNKRKLTQSPEGESDEFERIKKEK